MFVLLRQRNYALLWSSQLISQIGNWALFAALPFYVFQLTGSVLATGIMFAVEVIPRILFGSVAGVFVDRWDRRWTMIGANVARGLLLPCRPRYCRIICVYVRRGFVWPIVHRHTFLARPCVRLIEPRRADL